MNTPDYIDNHKYKLQTVLKQLIENQNQQDLDIATGFFRIEAWSRLEETMNHLNSLRLLIGRDPTIKPAEGDRVDLKKYFRREIQQQLNQRELKLEYKQQIDRLIEYLQQDHIQVRLYGATTSKFLHAKAYIFDHYSIVGSSNFTPSGIDSNDELNIVNKIEAIARDLRENWFEQFWNDESVDTDYKSKLIETLNASKFGSKAYTPYQVFLKALYELFKDESILSEGDRTTLELASFQQEGFERAIKLLERHKGCIVADAVGLGKTYIALRVIEHYLIKLRRPSYVPKALVMCPAQLRDLVWDTKLKEFGLRADIISQEEMGRQDFNYTPYLNYDLVVIDESHNFRNSATNRYQSLKKLLSGGKAKRVLLLTATPINNGIFDLYHQTLLLTRNNENYYQEWGIKTLKTYFQDLAQGQAEMTELLMQTMVRRSRQDVIKRQQAGEQIEIAGKPIKFPKRELEQFTYNFEDIFSGLYSGIANEISRLHLAPYNIKAFKKQFNQIDQQQVQRNRAIVALQKALYLKRLESSLIAFENTITNQRNFQTKFYQFLTEEDKILDSKNFRKLLMKTQLADDDENSLQEVFEKLESVAPKEYKIDELTQQIEADLNVLNGILTTLQQIKQSVAAGEDSDRKLVSFKDVLLTLKDQKILVFSYYRDTAQYIYQELQKDTQWQSDMGNPTLDLITGETSGKQREKKVRQFAPKANAETKEERDAIAQNATDILICTDVLSEGQNLQDAGVLVNYDLHWNPVRMIQRAGRIDRLGTDYETLSIYNCFPEEGLERLLGLVQRLQDRIADIDRSVGLDASVLGEEISNKSLEELQRLKQADSEAEKQAILEELEQVSDLVSLDEMRFPLLEFIQRVGQELVEEIPLGIHSTRYLNLPEPFSEGGIFLAFKARDRHFWHFYPRFNGFITTEPDQVITDKRKIFNWLKCQESDFPDPDSLEPIQFDKSIFYVLERATQNLLDYFRRQGAANRIKPRLSKNALEIKETLDQPNLWDTWNKDEQSVKDRVLTVINTSRELRSYEREIKAIWSNYRDHNDVKTLVNQLDELFTENELYTDIDEPSHESIRKVIKAEDLQLVCYEWFYPKGR